MSLLMSALKKAETTKAAGEASEADKGMAAPAAGFVRRDLTEELGLDPAPQGGQARLAKPESPIAPRPESAVATRLSLELEPDRLSPPAGSARLPNPGETPSQSTGATPRQFAASDAVQAARNVFGAKQKSPKIAAVKIGSRTAFYAIVGLCLIGGGGYAFYIWQQMQPPSPAALAARSTVPAAALATPVQAPVSAVPPSAPGALPPPEVPASVSSVLERQEPGASAVAPAARDRDVDRIYPQPAEPPRRDDPLAQNAPRQTVASRRDSARAEGGAAVDSPANLRISRTTAAAAVNPDVAAGYAALRGGDLDGASQAYERALRDDPGSRDALLGVASIQLRQNRIDAAEASFRRVLRLHPQDTYAAAQLAALQSGSDPVSAMSQVNSLIAREAVGSDAGNGTLPFIQGNQLAAQGRWNEAQQSYFNAHRADPNNPDYCYNLAVSLDRINESRLAREFYAKSLDLARSRPAGFDTSRAQTRLGQLGGAAGGAAK